MSPQAMERMLAPAFPGQHVVRARRVLTGRCNTNYQVWLSRQEEPVLLRLYVRDQAACARERAIHKLLQGRVLVPRVLFTGEADEQEGRPYAVFSWVQGVEMERWLEGADPADASRVAGQIGRAWAAMRDVEFAAPGFLDANLQVPEPLSDLIGFFISAIEQWLFGGTAGRRLGDDLARGVWGILTSERHLLDGVGKECTLVHADFRPENMLVRGNNGEWDLAAIVDWEFAHSGSGLFDAGQLFRFDDTLPPGFEEAFAAGVREGGGALPAEWRRMGRLIDFVNLVQMFDLPAERPIWHGRLRALVARIVEGWEPVR